MSLVLLAIPLVAIVASVRDLPKALGETRQPTIRIAMNPWPGFEVLYAAQELGLYREEGVNVQIVELTSLADSMRAITQNQVDAIACTSVEAVMMASAGNKNTTIVHAFDASHGADVLLARNDITSIQMLKDKRIGIEPTSLTTVILSEALSHADLTLADVELVVMDPNDMPSWLAANRIDAAVCYPPFSLQILNEPNSAISLFSSADIPNTILDVLAVDQNVLQNHPDTMRAVLRALRRATDLAHTRPDLVEPIMALRESLTVKQFRDAANTGMRRFTTSDQRAVLAPHGPVAHSLRTVLDAIRRAEGLPPQPTDAVLPEVLDLAGGPSP